MTRFGGPLYHFGFSFYWFNFSNMKGLNIMDDEIWRTIPEFPFYDINQFGEIYNNRTGRPISSSVNNFGHVKVTLRSELGVARTMSVALLVAQAFLEQPDEQSNSVILLDGDLQNVCVGNLARRPRWFAWKYARQLRKQQPDHYGDPVYNESLDRFYPSIIECGMEHGLLFADIWHSAHSNGRVYPYWWKFHAVEK